MRPIEIANPLAVVISKVASDKQKSIIRYCQSGNYSIGRFGQIWLQIRAVVYFYEVPPVLVPKHKFQNLGFRTSIFGSQDLGFRISTGRKYRTTSKALHPTIVLSFSRHFSLRPSSLFFFFPSLFSASSGHRQTDARTQQVTLYIRLVSVLVPLIN
jgi:hypothetical protein